MPAKQEGHSLLEVSPSTYPPPLGLAMVFVLFIHPFPTSLPISIPSASQSLQLSISHPFFPMDLIPLATAYSVPSCYICGIGPAHIAVARPLPPQECDPVFTKCRWILSLSAVFPPYLGQPTFVVLLSGAWLLEQCSNRFDLRFTPPIYARTVGHYQRFLYHSFSVSFSQIVLLSRTSNG